MENPKPRVLLIEDDRDYAELIGAKLSSRFDLLFARGLTEGMDSMDSRQPDAVLLDLGLPDGPANPSEVLDCVKRHRTCAAIVVVSGNDDTGVIKRMVNNNASGYLVKGRDDQIADRMIKEIENAIESQRFCNVAKTQN